MPKIFEKRFSDASEALEYLNSAKWSYTGRKGFIRKYDEFRGSRIYKNYGEWDDRDHEDALIARLSNDGYLSLHVKQSSSLGGIIGLPEYVWESLDNYHHMYRLVRVVNDKLDEIGSETNVVFSKRPQEYPLYSNTGTEPLEILSSPLQALKSIHNSNSLTEKEIKQFHLKWFNNQFK